MDPIEQQRAKFEARMQERWDERSRVAQERRENNEEDGTEQLEAFDRDFGPKIIKIRDQIETLVTAEDCNSLLEELESAETVLNSSTHFLNPYVIQNSQTTIETLYRQITEKKEAVAPKKKFAFNRKKLTNKPAAQAATTEQDRAPEIQIPGLEDLTGENRILQEGDLTSSQNYRIKNLNNCTISLLGTLQTVHIVDCNDCTINIGPISGSAHITNCTNCEFVLACHQLRIHHTHNSKFYVHVGSNPIVEHVSNCGFAQYRLSFDTLEEKLQSAGLTGENNWHNVQDFQWHKSEKSPNWYVIEEQVEVIRF